MITLWVFGSYFGNPDLSPFCMKADILLQMSGLPHRREVGDLRKAPKGKLPLIVEDGATIPDSTFIRLHLERKHGIDFDKGLTPEQRGIAWTLDKMLEDHLYWIGFSERWEIDENFQRGPAQLFKSVPALLRPLISAIVRRKMRGYLQGQGTGRHSRAERMELAERGFAAIATILGDKPYIMGPEPCGADATLGAFLISASNRLFASPVPDIVANHPNLVAYVARIKARYFADR